MNTQIYLIEDDIAVRRGCEQALVLAGMALRTFGDAESALAACTPVLPAVVVTDVRLPGISGIDLLERLQKMDRDIPVILMTGHGDVAMAVQAMRAGAYDFIEKPFASERLIDGVRRGLDKRLLLLENRRLREQLSERDGVHIIGQSRAMQEIRRTVAALADTNVDILINGETGAGKEVIARALHQSSGRKGEFVAVNCGALPESVFESEVFGHEPGAFTGAVKRRIGKIEFANEGTLFLDEIESMPLNLQVKLLRVLQERTLERLGSNERIPVNCRVLAATKADLKQLSDQGQFRADLYFRLNVVQIDLPPLRARLEDVPLLMLNLLTQAAQRYSKPVPEWTIADMLRWQQYNWPGNVRELKNVADRFCLGLPDGLLVEAATDTSLSGRLDAIEAGLIRDALRSAEGNVARTAELLQLPKKTLYDKLSRYGLQPDHFRSASPTPPASS